VASGSGTSGSVFDAILGAYRTASGFGGATAGDQASTLRETFASLAGSGSGASAAERLRETFNITVSAGLSSDDADTLRETFQSSMSSGQGDAPTVLWVNRGQVWNAVIKTRPMEFERSGASPFKRGTNYSVRVRR
jgi:hypothetical protein